MRTYLASLSCLAGLLVIASCNSSPSCGTGTIERGGKCVPADETTGSAACGTDTILIGNQCVSSVVCDPDTTTSTIDPSTGMTVCKGTGGSGGCGTCPAVASSSNQQTLCGQIYDFESGAAFTASGGTGMRCTTGATTGPCALQMHAYDATAFATNPQTAVPLAVADTCIDDMGRYILKDITVPAGVFIGVGLDDAAAADVGPTGITNTVGVATKKDPGVALPGFAHFIVKPSTTAAWAASGGGSLSTGFYAPVYRAHCLDDNNAGPGCSGDPLVTQGGVQFTRSKVTEPANTVYFGATETTRTNIDTAATATGVNGTALVNNATLADSLAYSGTGGLTDTTNCQWETKAGATLPGIVFIQIFRPVSIVGKTCTE